LKVSAYFRLMRFNKVSGTLLLWFPTAWALWIANQGMPPFALLGYFLAGTILMRAAGCIANDMADRHIDKHVKRTHLRPLTTGEISLLEALVLLGILLLGALYVVIQLPKICFYYALAALFITILYPFCKRFFEAPQFVLGLAFSMGIPMAYAASGIGFRLDMVVLFILNFAWIVSYDTMYAMADREDDLRIGVKSTAIFFKSHDKAVLLFLQIGFHSMWFFLSIKLKFSSLFYVFWCMALLVLIYQQWLLRKNDSREYLRAFSSNVIYGLFMWCALVGGL